MKYDNIFIGSDFMKLVKQLDGLRTCILSSVDGKQGHKLFLKSLLSLCLNMFKLDAGLISIPDKEVKVIQEYFYVISILIQCQRSAVRVSRKTWRDIEHQLLSLPD